MRKYRWPGYEMRLLGELQRQQNSTQFCDTLLQTEGISVPAHGCILAALSPYLSQKLSASPSPGSGQKRLLQLQPVKAQTLLKLVGLLYSGEVEVNGAVERNDFLAVAHIFGIKDLVEGDKNGKMDAGLREGLQLLGKFKEKSVQARCSKRKGSRKTQDAQVQAETAGRRDAGSLAENRNGVMTGTQTVSAPLNDAKATLERSTSAMSNNTMTFPCCLDNADSIEDQTRQHSEECWKSPQALAKTPAGPESGKSVGQMLDSGENTEEPRQACTDELLEEESGNSKEKRRPHANVGTKNLANMKRTQMLETTQISVKVKLRRRTKGEVWEVVGQQDADETLTVLSSHKQDDVNHKRLQKNPSPCAVEPDVQSLSSHPNTSCGSQPPACGVNLIDKDGFGTAPSPQHQGNVEESDEQIEKLLDDIMMGLNILPNLEKELKKPHDLQPGHVREPTTTGQFPVAQNIPEHGQTRPAVRGSTFRPDMRTQSGRAVPDSAQEPPDSGLLAVQPHGAVLQRLQPTADRTKCEAAPLSKIQECLHEESGACPAFCADQEQLRLPLQEAHGQDAEHILEHVPAVTGVEAQSEDIGFLLGIDDLQIPRCLSPLDPCTSSTKHQAIPYQANLTDNLTLPYEQQASLRGQPWLTENPGCLHFPFGGIPHLRDKALKHYTTCGPKQQQDKQELNPQNGESWTQSYTVKQMEERQTISGWKKDGAEPISEPRNIKDSLKCKEADTSGDPVSPKKRKKTCTSHPQDTASLLAYKGVRVGDGTKCIRMSSCSVILSSNNILAKEREMAVGSVNIPCRLKGGAHLQSATAESVKQKTKKKDARSMNQTLIRTRGFAKKDQQDSPRNAKPPVPQPVACRGSSVNNFPRTKRKCGRPPKSKVQCVTPPNNNAALAHKNNNGGQDNPAILSNVMQEEAPQKSKEEHPQKNQDEAAGQCTDSVDVEGLSRTTDSDDVEVDILLLSPHKTPTTALNMEIPLDEEDEDVTEIDVTGD